LIEKLDSFKAKSTHKGHEIHPELQGDALSNAISGIREELDDHLESINDNTNEIQYNFELLHALESKIDRLTQSIDKIQVFLEKNHNFKSDRQPQFKVKKLTKQEKEVFLVFYSLDQIKNGLVSFADLARRLCITENMAQNYINCFINKGIPVVKRYIDDKGYIGLNKDFKELQAKENILAIEQRILPNI